jgi:glycosyltransferase involved in cell wall biosynthesis
MKNRIAIFSDAWEPQVSGVVTTTIALKRSLENKGYSVLIIHPYLFHNFPCPTYDSLHLALFEFINLSRIEKLLKEFQPNAIHIMVEGPIGWAGRRYCLKHKVPFTTSYTTKFPEYISNRLLIPPSIIYKALRWFHESAKAVMVTTNAVKAELEEQGFKNIVKWTRGVDTNLFYPRDVYSDLPKPIYVYMGRLAQDKGIDDFLSLDLPGTKLVIGDGPYKNVLEHKYKSAIFTGSLKGNHLVEKMSLGDVFVFPSKTDTFGLVMLEAMACGLPVAAYPVTGPNEVVLNGKTGCLDQNLKAAIERAIHVNPKDCVTYANSFSWDNCAELFVSNLSFLIK